MSLESLATFFGWCTVFNLGFFLLTAVLILTMRSTMVRTHAAMFGVNEADLPGIYFRYLANYQTFFVLFSLFPYLALKMMS